ncbi:MAG: hypothetical protein QGG88_10685 [Gammaproteobacteria bacterium]|jgi:hypothetical protein|nr:hypothetical protein [Gammaproteobacteria bacterium]
MKIGMLALGRGTFDVEYANEKLHKMLTVLDQSRHTIIGPRELLLDAEQADKAAADLKDTDIDQLLILQVTFTDAAMTAKLAQAFTLPLSIWAVPEPRVGGRLRLNAFCGLNLASHALSLNNRQFSWLYADPTGRVMEDIEAMLAGNRQNIPLPTQDSIAFESNAGKQIVEALKGKRVGRIGEHPLGFDTCAYSGQEVEQLAGIKVDALQLSDLFDVADAASEEHVELVRKQAEQVADGLHEVDQIELDKSLRLKVGLDQLRETGGYDAFAIRCWPETFTEYGGAVCGPVSMMGEAQIPCACEADVYGALTQMVLQEATGQPVFLTDLVDLDVEDNTGVVWHCGQAPISMRASSTAATATIHTNRKMPLLYEFALKPGPVTMMRISQSHNSLKMVITYGEMQDRPMSFTGTSGVIRYERHAGQVLKNILDSGLEHHMALAYGDHRNILRAVAASMQLPLQEI